MYDNEPGYMSLDVAEAAHAGLLKDVSADLDRLYALRGHIQRSRRQAEGEEKAELAYLDSTLRRAEGFLLGALQALRGVGSLD